MQKYSYPMKIFLISSDNNKGLNPNFVDIGRCIHGKFNRLYIPINLNGLPKYVYIEKAIIYLFGITPIGNLYGTIQGYEATKKEKFFNKNIDGKPIFKRYYEGSNGIEIDITKLIQKYLDEDRKQAGLVLTTDESSFERARVSRKTFQDNQVRLLIFYQGSSEGQKSYDYKQINSLNECDDKCEYDRGCINRSRKSVFFQDIIRVGTNIQNYCSRPICVGELRLYTIFFKNNGNSAVNFTIENSTNGIDYLKTEELIQVEPGGYEGITSYLFSKYTRVVLSSESKKICGHITIQGQYYK